MFRAKLVMHVLRACFFRTSLLHSYPTRCSAAPSLAAVPPPHHLLAVPLPCLTFPLQALCTRWDSDPLCYGSYSSIVVGSTPEDYDAMAASVDRKLFFAGEATSR